MDALLTVALLGLRTERIELGTAVVPLQAQHPIALARQALSAHAITGGRLTLGVGPSHHWIVTDMLGLPYDKPAAYTRDYLEVLTAAFHAPTPVTVDVENATFTVHNPLDLAPVAPLQILVAALGPVMLKIAGERADGTVLWMADERAIGEHVVPTITKAADRAGRPAPRMVAGLPVCLCLNSQIDEARDRANRILGEAEISPNYQRLLNYGDAKDIGDLCAVGDETAIAARLQSFANAGATDLSIRLLPIGPTRESLIASKHRTRDLLAHLSQTLSQPPPPPRPPPMTTPAAPVTPTHPGALTLTPALAPEPPSATPSTPNATCHLRHRPARRGRPRHPPHPHHPHHQHHSPRPKDASLMGTEGPLVGIRILEVGHVLAGPYATMVLADLGAEVTKVEPPGGDISRQVSDSYFASLNRNKRSFRVDLVTQAGQEQLHQLAAGAHALLTNLRPPTIRAFGLTYDALKHVERPDRLRGGHRLRA